MTITHLAVYRGMTVSVYFLQKKSKDDPKNARHAKDNDKQEEMKESKAVYVTKNKIREDQHLVYQLYRAESDTAVERCESRIDFSCQYDSERDTEICTCKNVITVKKRLYNIKQYGGMPKQIYAYHGSRSNTDVGVGSVKTLSRRKAKKVYLPETDDIGVGSSELSWFMFRRSRYPKIVAVKGSFYDHKRTSSKCVGGIIEYNTGCVINEKLSPIIQTKSGSTSPKIVLESNNNEIGSNTVEKNYESIGIQYESENKEENHVIDDKTVEISVVRVKSVRRVSEHFSQKTNDANETHVEKKKEELDNKFKDVDNTFSSDSLVQHVYNLENPSHDKNSKASFQDPMENKLEREYRKMFSTTKSKDSKTSNDKPIPAYKSTSVLRRRFEALRRGIARKNDSNFKKDDSIIIKNSNPESSPSRKDVSITSDPPSLIARSISNSKKYSPAIHNVEWDKNNTSPNLNDKLGVQLPRVETESDCQGVKGMFKLWGKKFNFEDELNQKTPSEYTTNKKSEKEVRVAKTPSTTKKENKKFFFFKRKSKDKNKDAYKPKKDVTTGRCEISDGLSLKLGRTSSPKVKVSNISEEGEEITRKAWLRKFLTNTIESARSVNVRWNNSMYATSSSTVFELLDTVYKNNAIVLRSRSEITTEDSSYYKSYPKHKVNFVQDIEAWMIPKTIPDSLVKNHKPLKINSNKEIKKRNMEVTISDQKWYIDKSEAFSHKIQLVLHSKNFPKPNNNQKSSEYLRIDIPNDFFDASSDESKRNQSSEEEVYKIVEYETNSEFRRGTNAIKALEKGDHLVNDINVIVSIEEINNFESHTIDTDTTELPRQRDVVIQGSNVNIPKRCDVIGVGIITQRDLRELINPTLKIQDDLTDDESDEAQPVQKKCEFAESYLQEYYRQWTPLDLNLSPWCANEANHFKSSSGRSVSSLRNQQNGSRSCPNIYDDLQASYVSSITSTSSNCFYEDQCAIKENCFSAKLFKRRKKDSGNTETEDPNKRVLPKDSLEVFKRRKMYAASAKSQWIDNSFICGDDRPLSVPSIESKGAQNTTTECLRDKSIMRFKKRTCKKHVSLPDCETMNGLLNKQLAEAKPEGILQFKGGAGCEVCKKGSKCSKHAVVHPQPSSEIPQPPCKISCEMLEKPPCSRPYSPSCNVTPRSVTSGRSPICPKPPLPPTFGSDPSPCFPPQSPCSPSPCPAALPPCAKSQRKPSSTPTDKSSLPSVSSFSRPSTPKHSTSKRSYSASPCKSPPICTKPSAPVKKKSSSPCKKKPSPFQKSSDSSKKSKSPCSSPGGQRKSCSPCKKRSSRSSTRPPTQAYIKPSTPPYPKPVSPPRQTQSPSPCRNLSHTSCPCHDLSTPTDSTCIITPPCKLGTPPSITRCSQSTPSPVTPPIPCSGKTCPKTQPPCKKSQSHRPPCKKLLRAPPCKSDPAKCCHDYYSCDVSRKSTPVSPVPSFPKTSGDDMACSPQSSLPADNCGISPKTSQPTIPSCGPKPPPTPPKNFQAGPGSKTGLLLNKCPSPPVKKPPKRSLCKVPPCDQYTKTSKSKISPRNSNTSGPRSPKKENSSTCPPIQGNKSPHECKMTSSMKQPPPKEKDFIPDCANQNELKKRRSNQSCIEDICFPEPNRCPLPAQPQEPKCPPKCPPIGTNSKISGLFLKMRPSRKKTCAEDCTAWDINDELQGVIRISSHEKITISLKQKTPSTDEIRDCGEPKNIKVQDEDGKTLYERKDYTCAQNRPSVLGDMYRDSKINRVSAPIAVTNMAKNDVKEVSSCNSDQSLANSIEIQFKLRTSQGDKRTEINIGNDNDSKIAEKNHIQKAAPEVYIVNSGTEKNTEKNDPKNDINIKIIVRNFKPKHKNVKSIQYNDEYSKKISDKFHTVSTGYSDVTIEPNEDNIVSIHRTAVDLCSSRDESKALMNICDQEDNNLTQNEPHLIVSSHSNEHMPTDTTEDEFNELKSISSKKDSQSEDIEETNTNGSELPEFNDTDDQDAALLECNTSDECNVDNVMSKHASKELKKGLLKKIFQKAKAADGKNKKTVRQLRDMLKIILTDSSDNEARKITSKEIEKDSRFVPIKTNYYKGSESMNNLYQLESTLSSLRNTKIAAIYPSDEQRSITNKSSSSVASNIVFKGCICSKVAEKLNKSEINISCCCRKKIKQDEETNCDIRNAEDLFLLNYRSEYVDVETQHSKYLSSKINSVNVSIHSKNTSYIKTTKEAKVVEQLEIINRSKVKNEVKQTYSPHKSHNRNREMKVYEMKNTVRDFSDNDNLVVLKDNPTKLTKDTKNYSISYNTVTEADILQSYEAKKAVLEIYAEKAENGKHYVAKLPKFVNERESEITRNYEQIATNSYKSVCKQNIVMSIHR